MIDAAAFGKALFEIAEEQGTADRIREELSVIRHVLQEQPDYVSLLDTPALAAEEKLRLLQESFGTAEPMLRNFLCLLCEKRAIHQFTACATAFDRCYDTARGILRAMAITAVPMAPRQTAALRDRLEAITGKTVLLTNATDPDLIGGISLRYGGVQLDDSIRTRLDDLRRRLSDTIV